MRHALRFPAPKTPFSLVLISILLLCIAAAAQTAAEATKHNMQLLLSGQGSSLIDKQIVLYGVTAQGKPGVTNTAPKNQGVRYAPAFWIGPNKRQEILVTIPNGLLPVDTSNITRPVQPGDIVDITGTVRAAPGTTQLKAVYRLSSQGVTRVQRSRVIVEAGSVVVHGPANK